MFDAQRMNRPSESVLPGNDPSTSNTRGELTVEVRPDLDLSADDLAALNSFIESRPEVGVFMSRAWLSGFMADPPPSSELLIVLLRDGGALKAMAPLIVRRAFGHTRVCLLGGGAGSDRVDLLTARGYEAGCSDRFVAWLAET